MRRLTPDALQTQDAPRTLGPPPAMAAAAPGPDPAEAARASAAAHAAARKAAHDQGRADGLADAEREIATRVGRIEGELRQQHDAALRELEASRRRLDAVAQGLDGALAAHAQAGEAIAVEVAYAAVLRLLGTMAADRTLMVTLCRAVVRDYGHPPATLRVAEEDLPLLEDAQLELPVEADRRLAPGQCVVDTPRGQFESGLDVRLDALRQAFLAGLRAPRDTP